MGTVTTGFCVLRIPVAATSRQVLEETVSPKCLHSHDILLLTYFITSQRVAERTAQLAEQKIQKSGAEEHDQLLTDTDADWTEDDLATEDGIYPHANVLQQQDHNQQAKESSFGEGMESASDGLPATMNRLARRFSVGHLQDLDSPSGRCVLFSFWFILDCSLTFLQYPFHFRFDCISVHHDIRTVRRHDYLRSSKLSQCRHAA